MARCFDIEGKWGVGLCFILRPRVSLGDFFLSLSLRTRAGAFLITGVPYWGFFFFFSSLFPSSLFVYHQ